MPNESLLIVHDACAQHIDGLKKRLIGEGRVVRDIRAGQKNALDLGREEFYSLSSNDEKPIVAGYGRGTTLALAIAQRCPASGLICVSPADSPQNLDERRLSLNVERNLFLIVAPAVLAIGPNPTPLARKLIAGLSSEKVQIVRADDGELWSGDTLCAILEQLRNMRDTEALLLRQTFSL